MRIKETDFFWPSECPKGMYAGTVCIDDGLSPSFIYLYREAGQKFTDKNAFYKSLFYRGFRYLSYSNKKGIFEICNS
jgi:hypothetical protein